jgi:hypothetical protein
MEIQWIQKENSGKSIGTLLHYDAMPYRGFLIGDEWICYEVLDICSKNEFHVIEQGIRMPRDWVPKEVFSIGIYFGCIHCYVYLLQFQ